MSNIAANANRYNTSNTFRSDAAANTRGSARNGTGTAIGFDCSGLVYHVLRESGYNVPYAPSSAMVDKFTFAGSWATPVQPEGAVQPGTLVYFNGHVGIVKSYDPVTKTGQFLSMTGSNNVGELKPAEAFTTDRAANPSIHWGGTTAFKGFAEVKPELYDRTLDQHANGANSNTPVFNIPEASNAGFVTLPNNGGFPAPKSARDLSADVRVIAASTGIAPPPPIDLPNAATAFATALAALESNGQPNNGYGAWLQDGQGIGAIGRYGFRAPSLKAIGWMDSKGSWTDEARANGVDSPESFRDNPQAQEAARVEYMGKIKSELQANGAWAMIGKSVDGHVVTEAGLLAAAWKEGTGAVDKFFEGNSNNTNANTNILFRLDRFAQAALPAGGAVDAPTNPSIPTESPRTPYPSNSNTVHHADGDTTVSYVARADSTDGGIRKGDLVTYVQDADGKTTYFSVTHRGGNETTLQERVVDPVTGEITITYSQWVGSGPGSLQFQGQWDAAGNRVGDYYVQGGETYARTADSAGTTRWLNDRGQTRQEWLADPENPHSANAVNGSDLQSDLDSGLPEQHVLSDFGKALIDAFENSRTSSGGADTQYAEAATGTDTATDAGGGGDPEPTPNHQSDTHLNLIDLPAPELANHFTAGNAGGAYGAGQLGGFDVLPFTESSSFLVNEDGDITGEINLLSNGYHQVKNLYGDAVYVAPSGAVLSAHNYQEAQDKAQAQQLQDATTSLGLTQSILGLKHWDDMSELGKVSALTNIYNSVDKLNGGHLPGELSGLGSALGLLSALDRGDAGGALYSGIALGNALSASGQGASQAIGSAFGGVDAANVLPGLNLVLALDSGDPMATMAAAAAFIPVYGPLISAAISLFGGIFGDDDDPPPPPEGEVHFGWNAQGQIATELDRNQSGGGDSAQSIAGNLQALLQNFVQAHNSRNPSADDDLALNPYLIPRVGVSGGSPWLEVHLPNGQTIREAINGETIAERLLDILQRNGGIAPAWQIETTRQHWLADQAELATLQGQFSQAEAKLPRSAPDSEYGYGGGQLITSVQPVYRQVGYGEQTEWELVGDNAADVAAYEAAVQAIATKQAQIARALHAGEDGGIDASHPGGQAWALQGNAVEAADFKSQHYGALVVHAQASLNQTLGDIKTSQALRDAENDGYLEQTDWIAASDAQGKAQGLLVLDFSGNGVIETRDILNLGGNADPTGANPTDEARLASQNADLQRNNIGWLDGNGDHVLDARDPAFAAIKLWVDVNQDAVMQSGEGQSLAARGISSINFSSGQVSYTDGHTDALSATTLKADTEGFKLTQMFTGTADEFNRMQAAAARGDGATAQYIADAHNGGAMVEHEGYQGKQLISDAAGSRWVAEREQTYEHDALRTGDWEGTAAQEAHRHGGGNVAGAPVQTSATGVISTIGTTGISAISTSPINGPAQRMASTSSTVKVGDARLKSAPVVFVPAGAGSAQQAQREATAAMLRSADSSLFGGGNGALPLAALALGAGAVQWPTVAGAESPGTAPDVMPPAQVPASAAIPAPLTLSIPSTPQLAMGFVWSGGALTPVDLSVFQIGHIVTDVQPALSAVSGEAMPPLAADMSSTSSQTQPWAYLVPTPAGLVEDVPAAPTGGDMVLDYPKVVGEKVLGTEDTGLLMPQALLLANDSTVNESALHISAVSSPLHGSVGLRTNSSGSVEVVFIPEANYHGLASFDYTVTDRYGLSSTATATLLIAAVNDAPVTQGEQASGDEDATLMFNATDLLANDHDADTAVDGDVLRIMRVGLAAHGQVFLQPDGMVRFVPDADYNGPAQFSYWVGDRDAPSMATGTGLETQSSVSLNILPVNDLPVANGEQIDSDEDVALLISPALLLANDSDVDTATNGQVLAITAVGAAQHGTVALLPDGTIYFSPEPDYFGAASFSYTVDDGAGGTATALAVVNLAPVNDAPVATGESMSSDEDQVLTFTAAALLQNDQDIDSPHAELVIARVGEAEHGTVQLNAQGQVVFTPEVDYSGPASFAYWVADAQGLEAKATTVLTIAPVNDAPGVAGEIVTGASEDAVFHIDQAMLLANDNDVDDAHSQLKVSWVGNALGGTVALDAAGLVVFTPAPDFNGNAHFDYKVADTAGAESVAATAWVPVAAVNDVPVAVDDQFQTYRNSQMSIRFGQLKGNDRDADGDVLTVSQVANAQGGTALIDNGTVLFTPAADFTGTASFQYLADDQHGGQAWATAFVQVRSPPNQYPTMTMNSGSAWYLGSYSSVQYGNHSFTLRDDGDPGAIQFYFGGASVTVNGVGSTLSQGDAGASMNAPAGMFSWDVRNWAGGPGYTNQISVTWQLVDDRGLSNRVTWSLDSASWNGIQYTFTQTQEHTGYYFPPIVLDLNGDGIHFTSVSDSRVRWDVNFDGLADPMAWAGKDDGVLVWDKDHNAQITDASEFGFHKLTDGAQTDLEGLRALDSNQNGQLDAGDAKFAEFGVFQDANGNGITDAGEFKSLAELGIVQIALQSDGQMRDVGDDVTVMGQTTFMRSDGSTGVAADAMLAYRPAQAPADIPVGTYASAQADAQDAQLMRMALLFNQMVNTADSGAHEPLGFVPIAPDTLWHDTALMAEQHAQPQAQAA